MAARPLPPSEQLPGQVALPKTAAEVTAPATGVLMHPEYAKALGRLAYVWGWPMVNMLNRSAAITRAPEPGLLNGVLPVAPRGQVCMLADYIDPGQTFVTCPNQDVVYGLGCSVALHSDFKVVVYLTRRFHKRARLFAFFCDHE